MSTSTLQFNLVSQERSLFEGVVTKVILPATEGQVTILPGHIPLLTSVVAGEVIVHDEKGAEQLFVVSGGFIEVNKNIVTLLADVSERAEDIDHKRAEDARERARKAMSEGGTAITDDERFELVMAQERAQARLKVSSKLANTRSRR